MPFDPCRDWLGIDAVDLASPHKVLGLRADQADRLTIVQAADTRLSTLKAIDPGPFAKAHAAIVARVAQARDELLKNVAETAASLQRPSSGELSPPTPPRSQTLRPAPPPALPPPVPASPQQPLGFATSADQEDSYGNPVVRRSAVKKRGSNSGGVFATLLILVAVSAAIGAYAFWPTPVHRVAHHKVAPPSSTPPSSPVAPKLREDIREDVPENKGRLEPDRVAAPRSEAPPVPEARGAVEPEEPVVQQPQEDEESTQELQRQQSQERERLAAMQQKEKEKQERAEAEAREQEVGRLQASELSKAQSAVDRALGDTYSSLKRHDEDAARRSLREAMKAAGEHGDLVTRADRWALLVDYVVQLEGLQQQAIGSANAGREYKVGDRTVSIIEIGPKTFSYREAGRTSRGPRAALPRPIERAILAQWFDGDKRAANHIFLGVHHLLDDKPNLEKVRAQWEMAVAGEPATKSIMPLLDDPVLTGMR